MTYPTDIIKHLPDFLGQIPLSLWAKTIILPLNEKQYINELYGKISNTLWYFKSKQFVEFLHFKGIEGFLKQLHTYTHTHHQVM